MLAKGLQHLGVHIQTGRNTGVIVDHDRDRAVIGDLGEEGDDSLGIHSKMVVAGNEDKGEICACTGSGNRLIDYGSRGLPTAAEGEGYLAVEVMGYLVRVSDQRDFFGRRQGDRFTV